MLCMELSFTMYTPYLFPVQTGTVLHYGVCVVLLVSGKPVNLGRTFLTFIIDNNNFHPKIVNVSIAVVRYIHLSTECWPAFLDL